MKIVSINNHSRIVRQEGFLYESYRIIKLNNDEIKLFNKEIEFLLKEFKVDIVDNDLKIFCETIRPKPTRDNKVFNEHKEILERNVQKVYQILKEYKEAKNT